MGIDDLLARLDRLLGEQGLRDSSRNQAGVLHDALLELKVGIRDLRDSLAGTDRELIAEREELVTAERRGQLALGISDNETVEIARQFVERHRQRIDLLERKLSVQRDELAIAEREYEELSIRYRDARQGIVSEGRAPAGEDPPSRIDRRAAEAAVDAQLEMLKRKLGKKE